MRIIIQRVISASVKICQKVYNKIDNGFVILVGIHPNDTQEDIDYLVKKIANLRVFDDQNGVMNLSIKEINGEILAISQFTLLASTHKGNRPSYIRAAKPDTAAPLYQQFCVTLNNEIEKEVKKGIFGEDMKIELINNGPVTIIIDSKQKDY